jgi:ceramide glucosyltransferase
MQIFLSFLEWAFLVPALGGSVFAILSLLAVHRFLANSAYLPHNFFSGWPPVTILKPVCGTEKDQKQSLRSTCLQDYQEFQVVFSAQDPEDPAIPVLKEIQKEFGPEKVTVAIENYRVGPNGKINNLLGAFPHARNDIIVISDSDVRLGPDYLKTIVAPLADPEVGYVCTLYKAVSANRWFEKLELLTFNADFIPSVVFAHLSGASNSCLGASMAFRRSSLREIGGFEALADYLVEDYEMGRRIRSSGKKIALVPYFVEIVVDFGSFIQWWNHQIYWDQNTRAARPAGFFASVLTRSVPFAFLFAIARLGDATGLGVLAAALALRLTTAAATMMTFRDREGLKSLALLPIRDMMALFSWFLSFTKRTVLWRGTEFSLTRDGRLKPRESKP